MVRQRARPVSLYIPQTLSDQRAASDDIGMRLRLAALYHE